MHCAFSSFKTATASGSKGHHISVWDGAFPLYAEEWHGSGEKKYMQKNSTPHWPQYIFTLQFCHFQYRFILQWTISTIFQGVKKVYGGVVVYERHCLLTVRPSTMCQLSGHGGVSPPENTHIHSFSQTHHTQLQPSVLSTFANRYHVWILPIKGNIGGLLCERSQEQLTIFNDPNTIFNVSKLPRKHQCPTALLREHYK